MEAQKLQKQTVNPLNTSKIGVQDFYKKPTHVSEKSFRKVKSMSEGSQHNSDFPPTLGQHTSAVQFEASQEVSTASGMLCSSSLDVKQLIDLLLNCCSF